MEIINKCDEGPIWKVFEYIGKDGKKGRAGFPTKDKSNNLFDNIHNINYLDNPKFKYYFNKSYDKNSKSKSHQDKWYDINKNKIINYYMLFSGILYKFNVKIINKGRDRNGPYMILKSI